MKTCLQAAFHLLNGFKNQTFPKKVWIYFWINGIIMETQCLISFIFCLTYKNIPLPKFGIFEIFSHLWNFWDIKKMHGFSFKLTLN